MKVLTCNIRYFGADDKENSWKNRSRICAEIIGTQNPDIVCFQEMWEPQFAYLKNIFSNFRSYAMVDDSVGRHPVNCIFYRSKAFTKISSGGYWLSEKPHVAGSKSWGSCCVRLANWIRMRETSTGIEFRIINTHLDHVSQTAREKQAKLIVEDSQAYPDDFPQILTGDMNCDDANTTIDTFKAGAWRDTYSTIYGTGNPGCTRHDFLGSSCQSDVGKIDWIFLRGSATVVDAGIIRDSRDNQFPSDHYFVGADILLARPGNYD